jgi:uncharacterized protein (DUF2141 family)
MTSFSLVPRPSRECLLACGLVAVLALPAAAQPAAQPATAQPGCATVEVHNVRPGQGFLMRAAFADAASFRSKPAASLRLPAGEARMRFPLCGLTGNVVALTLFQDLDGDGKMGTNPVGMPTEPWGSSGTPGAFGPSWDTGKVALDGRSIVVLLSQ